MFCNKHGTDLIQQLQKCFKMRLKQCNNVFLGHNWKGYKKLNIRKKFI